MQSKVHPTYKTKYRVANWPAYNRALVRRADVRASHDSCNNAPDRNRVRIPAMKKGDLVQTPLGRGIVREVAESRTRARRGSPSRDGGAG